DAIRDLAAGAHFVGGPAAIPVDVRVFVALVDLAPPAIENLNVGAHDGARRFGPEPLIHVISVGRKDVGQQEEYAVVLASYVAESATHLGRIHGLHHVAAGPSSRGIGGQLVQIGDTCGTSARRHSGKQAEGACACAHAAVDTGGAAAVIPGHAVGPSKIVLPT
nr:hypothetical protein [Tanacetum cinerariifolium]